MNDKENARLALEYEATTAKFSEAVTDLNKTMQTSPKEKYERLDPAANQRMNPSGRDLPPNCILQLFPLLSDRGLFHIKIRSTSSVSPVVREAQNEKAHNGRDDRSTEHTELHLVL